MEIKFINNPRLRNNEHLQFHMEVKKSANLSDTKAFKIQDLFTNYLPWQGDVNKTSTLLQQIHVQ